MPRENIQTMLSFEKSKSSMLDVRYYSAEVPETAAWDAVRRKGGKYEVEMDTEVAAEPSIDLVVTAGNGETPPRHSRITRVWLRLLRDEECDLHEAAARNLAGHGTEYTCWVDLESPWRAGPSTGTIPALEATVTVTEGSVALPKTLLVTVTVRSVA
ncbi:hypothetical protein B0H14DRAFT_2648132 [Mycena olivaceomarginata]|nr:hypothetical protein B0H14DRAFT_2648132 [Mycena olivaceomarginata]